MCLLTVLQVNGQRYHVSYEKKTMNGNVVVEKKIDTIKSQSKPAVKQLKAGGQVKLLNSSSPSAECTCSCLGTLFTYLSASERLFIKDSAKVLVSSLLQDASEAGYNVVYTECPILAKNINKYFYSLTTASSTTLYKARIGDCVVSLSTTNGGAIPFNGLVSDGCVDGNTTFTSESVVHKIMNVTRSVKAFAKYAASSVFPSGPAEYTDTLTTQLVSSRTLISGSENFEINSYFAFDSLSTIPFNATIKSATLHLFADTAGFNPPSLPSAHVPGPHDNQFGEQFYEVLVTDGIWDYSFDYWDLLLELGGWEFDNGTFKITDPFEDKVFDIMDWMPTIMTYPGSSFYIDTWVVSGYMHYVTFASQRHPDPAKRPYLDITYSVPGSGESTRTELKIDSCYECTNVVSPICYSAVTDTSVNPYTYGIAGNWRASRTYAYYGSREQTSTAEATNIRTNGAIQDFAAFWGKVSGKNASWGAQYDTTRWVWNATSTLYNRKGAELENKDPLGRYNSGIYGYDDALPIAVTQNSRFRESAFDGFEDYNFTGANCNTFCDIPRSFNFSDAEFHLDSTQQHTGRFSMRVDAHKLASVSTPVTALNETLTDISFNMGANQCVPGTQVLKSVRAGTDLLLPSFSPLPGNKVVISAWVKEAQECKGLVYTGNQIIISTLAEGNPLSTLTAKPSGNIIEGWQRYEVVADIPAEATAFTITLQATGDAAVYLDDIRVHPYSANMKSFVYSPENLRLMAELDENNYATFYEYDDDGTLVRLKKETSRGIITIRETRSSLITR